MKKLLLLLLVLILFTFSCATDEQEPFNYLTETVPITDGVCDFGGLAINGGEDLNRNDILDPNEITDIVNTCNDSDGVSFIIPADIPFEDIPLAFVQPAYNLKCGTDGGAAEGIGGKILTVGFDTNGDGYLDYDWDHLLIPNGELTVWKNLCLEIRSGRMLTVITYTFPDDTCPLGGYVVQGGVDLNETDFLEPDEIQFTESFCIEEK